MKGKRKVKEGFLSIEGVPNVLYAQCNCQCRLLQIDVRLAFSNLAIPKE
jgi:hypothetical protein